MKIATSFASPLLLLLFFVLNLPAFAQAPAVAWYKSLGGKNGDYLWSIEQTSDGGYIAAGYTEGTDDGDIMGYHGNQDVGDIWLVRLNSAGNLLWQKCLGSKYYESDGFVRQTPDGGFIVVGTSATHNCQGLNSHGGSDYFVTKLDAKGEILWQKLYGSTWNDYAHSLDFTSDGGYVVAGLAGTSDGDVTGVHGGSDFWVIKIDGSGNLLWQKAFGGSGDEAATSIKSTPDGGYIVAGYTLSSDGDVTGHHGDRDYWVIKLSSTGTLQWQKTLGSSGEDLAWSVKLTNDGGYMVAGYISSNDGDVTGSHGGRECWLAKLDGGGNLLWQKCYGGMFNDEAIGMDNTPDGGFVVVGTAESYDGDASCNAGLVDSWVFKINSAGDLEWQKPLGGNYIDEGRAVQSLKDGSYIVGGGTCSKNVPGYHIHDTYISTCADFWIIKLTAPGSPVPAPKVSISPASGSICAGATASFTAAIQYAGVNPKIDWRKNGTLVGSNITTLEMTGLVTGDQISCTVTNGGVCETGSPQAATASVQITTITQTIDPQVTITTDNTVVCDCSTFTSKVSVTNGGTAQTFLWLVNNMSTGFTGNSFSSSSLKPGDVIKCRYTDPSGCVVNGRVFSNTITLQEGSTAMPTVTIATPSGPVCEGSTITFTASPMNAGQNPSYQWKVNGINKGTNQPQFSSTALQNGDIVTCTLLNDPSFTCATTGTANSNPITVAINKKADPLVSIASPATTACAGTPVNFIATATNAGQSPSYQWTINGVNAGTNSSSFTSNSLSDGDIVRCSVMTDPLFTCALSNTASSNSIRMTITQALPPVVTIAVSDNNVCEGTLLNFTANPENAGSSPSYRWAINNTPTGDRFSSFTSKSLKNGDLVTCEMTPDQNSCSTAPVRSNALAMALYPLPVVNIRPEDTLVALGSSVLLKALVADPAASFTWSPASQLQDPMTLSPVTVPLYDNAIFTLTVQAANGCTAMASAKINITKLLLMPNAFTPNGDGTNDVFRIPVGAPLRLSEFSIYDRWGRLLFSTSDSSKGWDGTVNGVKVVSGVYAYLIRGTNDKGNVLLKGTVMLLR